jgi:hypothetical protein
MSRCGIIDLYRRIRRKRVAPEPPLNFLGVKVVSEGASVQVGRRTDCITTDNREDDPSHRSSHPAHPHLVALELDTNDAIKSEPAPRKRENWIENHEPIPNPNQLFDLAISNCKTIRAIYIYMWKGRGNHLNCFGSCHCAAPAFMDG